MHTTASSSPAVSSQRLDAITLISLSRPDVRNELLGIGRRKRF